MSHEEQGIAQAQIAAEQSRRARGEKLHQDENFPSGSLNERVLLYLGVIVFIGLLVMWATASSPWLLYGSLVLAIGLTVLWGYLRLARNRRIEAMRARQVEALQAQRDSPPPQ